jgi:hypothetical protein
MDLRSIDCGSSTALFCHRSQSYFGFQLYMDTDCLVEYSICKLPLQPHSQTIYGGDAKV